MDSETWTFLQYFCTGPGQFVLKFWEQFKGAEGELSIMYHPFCRSVYIHRVPEKSKPIDV